MSTMIKKFWVLVCVSLLVLNSVHAQSWQWANPALNGSITMKSVDGMSSISATQNPTGAVAKTNQTAVTAAPLMVVQATAQLPVVTEGAACVVPADQYGTKADLSIIYGCRLGVWTKMDIVPTVATVNTACPIQGQIAQDSTGLTLSCQAGTWKKALGGGSGLTGLYSTIGEKSVSCQVNDGYGGYYIYYARIDAIGMPSVRIFQYPNIFDISNGIGSSDTGWVTGQSTSLSGWGGSGYWNVILNTGGLEGYGYTFQAQRYLLCSRSWPYT